MQREKKATTLQLESGGIEHCGRFLITAAFSCDRPLFVSRATCFEHVTAAQFDLNGVTH